jgi:hypothetical protein
MEEGFSDEANKLPRKYSSIVWKLEIHSCDQKSPSLVPLLSWINPVQVLP